MSHPTTSKLASCPHRDLVDRHFACRISPRAARRLREHLPHCPACRGYYERHMLLARIDPSAHDARQRLARGLGIRIEGRTPRHMGWMAVAGAVAAALVVVLLHPWQTPPPAGDGFTARGDPALATELLIFDADKGPVARKIRPTDELAIAYRNGAARKRLMVFGVDDRGAVYWYHPAWQDPAADPEAIAIRSESGIHELPEAVRHEIAGTRLTIYGIFVDRPLTVRQVEQMIQGIRPGEVLPLEDAVQRRVTLSVQRGKD